MDKCVSVYVCTTHKHRCGPGVCLLCVRGVFAYLGCVSSPIGVYMIYTHGMGRGGRASGRAAVGGGRILYLHSNFRSCSSNAATSFSCYFLCVFIFQFYADARKTRAPKSKNIIIKSRQRGSWMRLHRKKS